MACRFNWPGWKNGLILIECCLVIILAELLPPASRATEWSEPENFQDEILYDPEVPPTNSSSFTQNTANNTPFDSTMPKLPPTIESSWVPRKDAALSDEYPQLNNSFVQNLVNQARKKAEDLFDALLVDPQQVEEGDEDKDAHSKREFPNKYQRTVFPVVSNNSAAAGLGRFGARTERVVPVTQQANVLLEVVQRVTDDENNHVSLNDVSGLSVPQFRSICPVPKEFPAVSLMKPFDPNNLPQCALEKYRRMNGFCNNIAFHNRGKESTIYRRLLVANYGDGISSARRSVTGSDLPGARLVSISVFDNLEAPGAEVSAMAVHFGQFLAHEMIHSPSSKTADDKTPKCCNAALPTHPDCWPIDIPTNDEYSLRHGRTCHEFVRTMAGVRPGCTLGPREQLNQVTHFIDGSAVYGSTDADASALRSFDKGQLRNTQVVGVRDFKLLPQTSPGASDNCPGLHAHAAGLECFAGGDKRVNVQPGLTMVHTIFMRHHDKLAQSLAAVNPHWDDERVFQEARRILAAQLQHIVYNEFLPAIIGQPLMKSFNIALQPSGKFRGHDISAHPAITSEFAVAGYRLHSTIPPVIALRNPDLSRAKPKRLRDSFFNPYDLYQSYYFTECGVGMTAGIWDKMDHHFNREIQDHLFQGPTETIGLDLPAIDIQRGRDHGLQPYVKYRELCRLRVPKNFEDLRRMGVMPEEAVDRLTRVYQSVEDVDLFVGATLEKQIAGGSVGPTSACIIGEQFYRLRIGDRFWYENDLPLPSAFNQAQIDAIRRTSFAWIWCTNVEGLTTIQSNVFRSVNGNNPRVPCLSLPPMTFDAWKE